MYTQRPNHTPRMRMQISQHNDCTIATRSPPERPRSTPTPCPAARTKTYRDMAGQRRLRTPDSRAHPLPSRSRRLLAADVRPAGSQRRLKNSAGRPGRSLDHCKLEVSLDHLLAVDIGDTLHLDEAEPCLECDKLHFHDERVAGHNRSAPLDVVDACKEEVALAVGDGLLERHYAADLRHRLHLQHAGHDGAAREVAIEVLLVGRHLLHTDRALACLELDNLVDEEERVAVRQDLLDAVHLKDGFRLCKRLGPHGRAAPV
mmetsp:Transcript_2071/g.6817  ORF Transcript_2071/g.6817 Transcript_2071/m.6817 type:complete len:260 (+) Transcript_2071:29-808(+)